MLRLFNSSHNALRLALLVVWFQIAVNLVEAAVTITVSQTNAGVVFSYTGSIVLGIPIDPAPTCSNGNLATADFFSCPAAATDYFTQPIDPNVAGTLNLGTLTSPAAATPAAGSNPFGIDAAGNVVRIVDGYNSGDPIVGSVTFAGSTYASLGITAAPGTVNTFDVLRGGPGPPAFPPATDVLDTVTLVLTAIGGTNGDPHFLRWGQQLRDSFHGACDLVLVSNQKDVHVHLRTKIRKFYSYNAVVAVGVGPHVMEFNQTHVVTAGGSLVRNLENEKEAANFPIVLRDTGDSIINGQNTERFTAVTIEAIGYKKCMITWGTIARITVAIEGIFLNVQVQGGPEFAGGHGMMGEYPNGTMLDRQGNLMNSSDFVSYGMEWQVKQDHGDPILFSTSEGAQWPLQKCIMPHWVDSKQKRRRNIRAKRALGAAAKLACAGVLQYEYCIQDVLERGDFGLAEYYH